MEDILASIKRIIADDSQTATAAVYRVEQVAETKEILRHGGLHLVDDGGAMDDTAEEVLELTQPIEPSESPAPAAAEFRPGVQPRESVRGPEASVERARPASHVASPIPSIVSEDTATASRQSLAALSAMVVKPEEGADNTLDGLVREMLRPMLKDWLDQRLPHLVEKLVEKEIGRITGRTL